MGPSSPARVIAMIGTSGQLRPLLLSGKHDSGQKESKNRRRVHCTSARSTARKRLRRGVQA